MHHHRFLLVLIVVIGPLKVKIIVKRQIIVKRR
jgi:hypothetical protein